MEKQGERYLLMTIKELYNWAIEHASEDLPFYINISDKNLDDNLSINDFSDEATTPQVEVNPTHTSVWMTVEPTIRIDRE